MKKILVKSSRGNYSILIGNHLLKKTGGLLKGLGLKGKAMIVTQEKIACHFLSGVESSCRRAGFKVFSHVVPDGEEAKSDKELFRLYHELLNQDFERRDFLVALGGGTVGDLTGFAAASFMRGVPWVGIGTTLLAQVDSSIGGKTGINLTEGKNLIGAFYPPQIVISDPATLATLPAREYQAALGEVVKYGVIRDAKLFRFLETHVNEILDKDSSAVEKIVEASSRIKAGVVTRDEYETKGERMILNFGHTFAHGIEQALHYRKLFHGEAVAIGMVLAARLALKLKMFSREGETRLSNLLESFHLPTSLASLGLEARDVFTGMASDKKKRGGRLRFVLPRALGKVVVREGISDRIVLTVLKELGAQ